MARFFFHVNNGADVPDETGTVLNCIEEARQEVLLTGSELLRGDSDELWRGGSNWAMRVTDEAGTTLFTLRIAMEEHPILLSELHRN
jgi:hypothetical protein